MTSKTLNRVAEAINNLQHNKICNVTVLDMESCEEIANTAIKALDVIVLPAGSEAEVGDLVGVIGGHDNNLHDIIKNINKDGEVDLFYYGTDYLDFDYELEESEKFKGFKIIQRKGIPVIMDEEQTVGGK